MKADGSVNVLPNSNNICLGVTEKFPYQESTLKLDKGDTLVTFTDGVTEACDCNNELYGETRLESLLATQKGNTAEQVTTAINDAVNAHANGAEQSDDITMLALKRLS
jgi:sigma-B regulation protein RsbU (phosphoserine phosphatase)